MPAIYWKPRKTVIGTPFFRFREPVPTRGWGAWRLGEFSLPVGGEFRQPTTTLGFRHLRAEVLSEQIPTTDLLSDSRVPPQTGCVALTKEEPTRSRPEQRMGSPKKPTAAAYCAGGGPQEGSEQECNAPSLKTLKLAVRAHAAAAALCWRSPHAGSVTAAPCRCRAGRAVSGAIRAPRQDAPSTHEDSHHHSHRRHRRHRRQSLRRCPVSVAVPAVDTSGPDAPPVTPDPSHFLTMRVRKKRFSVFPE